MANLKANLRSPVPGTVQDFDVRNGKAITYPAVIDIPAFPVRVVDGEY